MCGIVSGAGQAKELRSRSGACERGLKHTTDTWEFGGMPSTISGLEIQL